MRIKRLNWDKRNVIHIARHGITVKNVEDACSNRHIARKVKAIYLIYGETEAGRHIFIVLEKTGDNFRPITARDISESEKKIFKRKMKEINRMPEMKLPKFKSEEEEAAFWDSFDTAQILEEGEEIELEYKPEPEEEDICIQCGERMKERKRDIDLPGEEITIHVKEYYCPRCKKSMLETVEAKRLSKILVGLLGVRGRGAIERDTEVYKDKEGFFVRIPVEIVKSLDVTEMKRTKIWCMGKRIILEIR